MENLLFLVLGILLTLIFTRKPIQFTVHHKYENINPPLTDIDMGELEKKMLTEDPKAEADYKALDEVIAEVSDIMGGSDR